MIRLLKDLARKVIPNSVLKQINGRKFAGKSPEEVFNQIFRDEHWKHQGESVSGAGSEMAATATIRKRLPDLFKKYQINTMLDIPCGDLHWMTDILDRTDVQYTGGDIVRDLIERNQKQYGRQGVNFKHLDLIDGPLPQVDLVLSRDVWIHFSFEHIQRSIRTLVDSGSTYLLASTYPATDLNRDIHTGNSRPIDLTKAPFNFPPPVESIQEDSPDGVNKATRSKQLALWRIADLKKTLK